ncbi:hypothetical protein Efla_001177 [Eimeria flavescens]
MASNNFYTMRPVIPQSRSDTGSRVTIKNIPAGVTEAQLKANLSKHGDIRIHMYVPGTEYGLGWAWVTCEKHEDVEKMLSVAEERRQQAAVTLREDIKSEKQEAAGKEEADTAAETSSDEAKGVEGEVSDA